MSRILLPYVLFLDHGFFMVSRAKRLIIAALATARYSVISPDVVDEACYRFG
jgi:hypothetical protein